MTTRKHLQSALYVLLCLAAAFTILVLVRATAHACTPAAGQCCQDTPCLTAPAFNLWEIPTQAIGKPVTFCTSASCVAGTINNGRELGTPTPAIADQPGKPAHRMVYEITAANLASGLPPTPFNITVPGVAALLKVTSVSRNGRQLHVQANKSLSAPLPPIPSADPAWLCFGADQQGQTALSVTAPDQFGTPIVKIGNLTHLCVRGTFDGSIPPAGLVFACFQGGQQKPLVNPPQVWVSDPIKQFTVDVHPDHQGFCAAATVL